MSTDTTLDHTTRDALFEYLLRLGDDLLVLGHRLSEWCGHGPILEEDVALANMALDAIGQAEALLKLAASVEDQGRSADDLAYFRDEYEFRNLLLVEQPRGDFAFTIARQFLFCAFAYLLYRELQKSAYQTLADIAAKSHKELTYHLRHARSWLHRLGDGTRESHARMQTALDQTWRYTAEFFFMDRVDARLIEQGMAPDLKKIEPEWRELVMGEIQEATLSVPQTAMAHVARQGNHGEHLGHMLAEMQILRRSHPDGVW